MTDRRDFENPFQMFQGFHPFMQRGGTVNERYTTMLENLRSEDPMQVLQTVNELQMELSVAQEDSMSSFPVDQFVVALTEWVRNEILPDIPMYATIWITHLVDIFPNVGNMFVSCGGISALCQKLGNFEFIDMAEHAIKALEKFSYDNAPAILKEGGFATILNLLDFFEINTQKTALQAIVNATKQIRGEDMFLESILPLVPVFINHVYYKSEDQLFANEKALDFFLHICDSIAEFSVDSIDRARCNIELITENGLINALIELVEHAEQFWGKIFRLLRVVCQNSILNTVCFLEAGAAQIINKCLNAPGAQPNYIMELLQLINTILPKRNAESQLEEERVGIYKGNTELLRTLGESILPFIFHVHEHHVSKGLKSVALDILDKLLLYLDKDLLLTFIKPTEFSAFLAELLGSKEATTVKTALSIVRLVYDIIPEQVHTSFVREGVISKLHRLTYYDEFEGLIIQTPQRRVPAMPNRQNIKQFLLKSGITPDSQMFEHILGTLEKKRLAKGLMGDEEEDEPELKRAESEPVPKEKADPLEEVKTEIIGLANDTIKYLNFTSEIPHVLNELRQIARRLNESGREALEDFANMLRDGITCHELSASNFIQSLWGWLTTPSDHSSLADTNNITYNDYSMLIKRISIFYEVIGVQFNDGFLIEEFLKLLENIIKFHQRYNILLHEPIGGSGGHLGYSVRALTQKIRIKFVYTPETHPVTGELAQRHQIFTQNSAFTLYVDQFELVDNIISELGKIRSRRDLSECKRILDTGEYRGDARDPMMQQARLQDTLRSNFASTMSEMGLEMEGNEEMMKEIHAQTLHATLASGPEEGFMAEDLPEVPQEHNTSNDVFEAVITCNKQRIDKGCTIFEALQRISKEQAFLPDASHLLQFRIIQKVDSSQSNEVQSKHLADQPAQLQDMFDQATCVGVKESDPLYPTLRMLKLLFLFNNNPEVIGYFIQNSCTPRTVSPNSFINQKLTALAARQLQDMLTITRNIQPEWIALLAKETQFLFGYGLRSEILKAAGFGGQRSLYYYANKFKLSNVRIFRQKVKIPREKIFEAGQKVMESLAQIRHGMLDVEYYDEEGTGVGPTLEFYSLLSKDIRQLSIWRNGGHELGLFPSPCAKSKKSLEYFTFVGTAIAKAILDDHMVDLPMSPAFWTLIFRKNYAITDLNYIDKDLASTMIILQELVNRRLEILRDTEQEPDQKERLINNLNFKGVPVDQLGLVFTLPGYDEIELIPNGKNLEVSIENLDQYWKLVVEGTVGMVEAAEHFRGGFGKLISIDKLTGFTGQELEFLICGAESSEWTYDDLFESLVAAHGYQKSSESFLNLIQVMLSLTPAEKRMFLSFVTGSPRLPNGGFKALNPPLTVVKKDPTDPWANKDHYLPSVMTCQNYLKMPDYSSVDVMKIQLQYAFSECAESFHLS